MVIRLFFLMIVNVSFLRAASSQQLIIPEGHIASMTQIGFSPDGVHVLTGSMDNTAKLWETSSGKLLATFDGHTDGIDIAKFSPDNNFILVASYKAVKIYDSHTAVLLFTLDNLKGVHCANFSADSKSLIVVDHDVRIYDLQTGKLTLEIAEENWAYSGFFISGGKKIVLKNIRDAPVNIRDASTGELLDTIEMSSGPVLSLEQDEKDNIMIACKNLIKIFHIDSKGHKEINSTKITGVKTAMFLPGFETILVQTDSSVYLVSRHKNEIRKIPFGAAVYSAQIFKENILSVKMINSPYVLLWDIKGDSVFKKVNCNLISAVHPNGKKFLGSFRGGELAVLSYPGLKVLTGFDHSVEVLNAVAFNPDQQEIVSAAKNREIHFWQLDKMDQPVVYAHAYSKKPFQAERRQSDTNDSYNRSITNSPSMVKIWSWPLQKAYEALPRGEFGGGPVRFGKENKRILLANGNSAYLYDIEKDSVMQSFRGHSWTISSLALSRNEKYVVSTSRDRTCKVWDVNTGKVIFSSSRNWGYTSGEFIDDDTKIVTGQDSWLTYWNLRDGAVTVADSFLTSGKVSILESVSGRFLPVVTGKELRLIYNDRQTVVQPGKNSLYFSKFNKAETMLVTATRDEFVSVWSVGSGELLKRIYTGKNNVITDVDFENGLVAGISSGSKLLTWNLNSGDERSLSVVLDSVNYLTKIPSGYYQCTPAAARALHYVTKDLKVITFDQLDIKYNRPDKVLQAVGNKDTLLINFYKKAWEKRIKRLGIDTAGFRDGYSIPEGGVLNSDSIKDEQTNADLRIRIYGRDSLYTIERANVWINEVPVFGQKGLDLSGRKIHSIDTAFTIKLSAGENIIESSIINTNGTESFRQPLITKYTPAAPIPEKVYFMGIGIDHFKDSRFNLLYSVKDIRDLANKFREKYPAAIIIDTLFNESVSVERIKKMKQALMTTTENDKVIIAYSGHGLLSREYDYYLSTYGVDFENPIVNGLAYSELENLVDSIPARKKIMLIDACHSGELDKDDISELNNAPDTLIKGLKPVAHNKANHVGLKSSFELMQSLFANVSRNTGTTVLSAAAGTQFALERNDLKNGVFTYSILEAMKTYKTLTLGELKKIITQRVQDITKGLQQPTFRNENNAVDWSLW